MTILSRLVLAASLAASIAPPALACGPVTQTKPIAARPRTAIGTLVVSANSTGIEYGYGIDWMTLQYPKFSSGEFLYIHKFTVASDAKLQRLERASEQRLANGRSTYATVELEQSGDGWRVVSWHIDRQ